MHGLWGAFRDGGWANFISLLFFLPAFVLAIVAIALAGKRAGRVLGAMTVGMGALILMVGALGTWSGHRVVEGALRGDFIRASQKERIRHEGYLEARRSAQFGLGFAALPVLLGSVALVVANRKARGGVALPLVMCGIAGALAVADGAMSVQRPPGRDLAVDDPAWHLLDANGDLAPCLASASACTTTEVSRGCGALDQALHPSAGHAQYSFDLRDEPADPSKVPDVDVPKLVAFCRAHGEKI